MNLDPTPLHGQDGAIDTMSRADAYALLTEIMRGILLRNHVVWRPETRLADIDGWNSNKTVATVIALEKRLRRDLPRESLEHISTPGELAALVLDGHEAVPDVPSGNEFSAFESVGEDCEFGIVQQAAGIMRPHLLRFCSFSGNPAERLDRLIAALNDDFSRLVEPNLLDIALPAKEWDGAEKEYRYVNSFYGMQVHTGITSSTMDAETARRHLRDFPESLAFMRARFLHRLQEGSISWIWKSAPPSPRPQVETLLAALQKHGPNRLLWVVPAYGDHPPGEIVQLGEHFFKGHIFKSSGPWAGNWSDGDAWTALIKATQSVLPAPDQEIPHMHGGQGISQSVIDQAHQLLTEVVGFTLEDPELTLGLETTPADVDGWDSIQHIKIILDLEKRLGCMFSQTDLDNLTNVEDFVMLISQHIAARNLV